VGAGGRSAIDILIRIFFLFLDLDIHSNDEPF